MKATNKVRSSIPANAVISICVAGSVFAMAVVTFATVLPSKTNATFFVDDEDDLILVAI